ncbi:MAG: NAD(P)H-hydrate dehydratase [Gammaproteobacteria bacterium]|nr:NAD(P)H-hydrate dehydratase [Gammaproteobacteria bacterium]MDH5729815.1 NAD(P)H-hydrate dehydratase [Gammaproteobacteria bacterium]
MQFKHHVLPRELYTAAQVRELDRRIIESQGIPGYELMQHAAQAAFDFLRQRWPQAQNLVFVCGAGNNAGDAYVMAKLALEAGLQSQVLYLCEPEHLKGEAKLAAMDATKAGVNIQGFTIAQLSQSDLIVDGLLGTGLHRAVTGIWAETIRAINASALEVLALDIPSGLSADTGNILGEAIRANATISFIALKQGLFTADAYDCCGEIIYADLGAQAQLFQSQTPSAYLLSNWPALPPRKNNSHKNDFGHVLVIGGNHGMAGAAHLAGLAALRSGAGLVSIATRQQHANQLGIQSPELMVSAVENKQALQTLLHRATVIVMGPGMGEDEWAVSVFNQSLQANKPIVIDASGLNLLAQHPQKRDHWVLTPHPGEAARLLHCSPAQVQQQRFQHLQQLQQTYGGVCLLKGAGTCIADAIQTQVVANANPAMATAGMGDVLSGVIGALMAQIGDWSLLDIVSTAALVHAKAAEQASQGRQRGLIASDVIQQLPSVLGA